MVCSFVSSKEVLSRREMRRRRLNFDSLDSLRAASLRRLLRLSILALGAQHSFP